MPHTLFTIGHSNHSLAHFVLMLREHGITAIADVRSAPYSRRYPHFSREDLSEVLSASANIAYVYLGKELGARRQESSCYDESGRVVFDRVAETESFRHGIHRLLHGLEDYTVAMMCAEHDPLDCHRGILITPRVTDQVQEVRHVLRDGTAETHTETEERLLRLHDLPNRGLFHTHDDMVREAYGLQEAKIAYRRETVDQ